MHAPKSLEVKNHIVFFIQQTKVKKKTYYFSMHFSFNNQFIKVMRTWPIFQKKIKKYFVLF